jgi:hypothetical protein
VPSDGHHIAGQSSIAAGMWTWRGPSSKNGGGIYSALFGLPLQVFSLFWLPPIQEGSIFLRHNE